MTNIDSKVWWWDLWSRIYRQAYQVAVPFLAAVTFSGLDGFDWSALFWAVLGAVALTVLRAVSGLRAGKDSPEWLQVLDRALAAGAGALLGWWTADGFSPLHADWPTILGSTGATIVIAVLGGFLDPGVPGGAVTVGEDGQLVDDLDAGRTQVGVAVALAAVVAVLVLAPVVAPTVAADGPSGADSRMWKSVPVVPLP